MDKYEYQVKTEEMLQYMDQKDYKKAMEIADGIDWKHVKNVLMLCKVSEIYEYNRDYQRSREILFFAYDRRPGSRKIVYRLGTLALKLGDTDEAQDCYEEYVNLAPKDPNQYVLRYKIQKAKGLPLDDQIETLADFKKVEYIEKWAYELATLYHEAGRTDECLAECDDLILWFSEGKYVYKAMELKQQYKPLTPLQQEKYDQYLAEEEARRKNRDRSLDVAEAVAVAEAIQEDLPAEFRDRVNEVEDVDIDADKSKILAKTIDRDDSEERDPKVSTFAGIAQALEAVSQGSAKVVEKLTGNIQPEEVEQAEKALEEEQQDRTPGDAVPEAEGLDDLLASWESGQEEPVDEEPAVQETVSEEVQPEPVYVEPVPAEEPVDTVQAEEPIDYAVPEVPDLSDEIIPDEEPAAEEEPVFDEVEEEADDLQNELEPDLYEAQEPQVEAEAAEEEPVTPQKVAATEISIDSFLADLKKDQEEAEAAEEAEESPEAEEPQTEPEAEEQFEEELPPEMAKTKRFSLHEEFDEDEFEDEDLIEEATEDLAAKLPDEDLFEEATEDFAEEDIEDQILEEEFAEDDFAEDDFAEDDFSEEIFDEDEFTEDEIEEEGFAEEDFSEETFDRDEFREDEFPEEELAQEELPDDEFAEEDPFDLEDLDDLAEDGWLEESLDDTDTIEVEDEIEERMSSSDGGVSFDTGFVVQGRYDLETQSEIGLKAGLTQEQKELFSYFVPVQGMSEQIVAVLENDAKCTDRYGTSRTGNLLIIGHKGSGKTVLAVDIIKAIQKNRNLEKGRVAIIDAEKLNHKDLNAIVERLAGGALVIEQAGAMNAETVHQLNELMEGQTKEMFVVLEEQQNPMAQLLHQYPVFAGKFTSKLEVPVFINDDLVAFGQTYAKENGFKIDEMGILALYSRIDALQREDHAVTVAEVKEIMDEAIAHSRKSVKKIFRRNKDGSNRVILQELDFQK